MHFTLDSRSDFVQCGLKCNLYVGAGGLGPEYPLKVGERSIELELDKMLFCKVQCAMSAQDGWIIIMIQCN